MFVRVEPSGCCERKGLVQIRFCMYLDEGDYGYDIHHIQVPERPLTEKEISNPKLAEKVKKVWQTNPFHNHFIYVEPDTSDEEIMNIGQAFLEEAYIKWACEERLDPKNPPVKFHPSRDNDKLKAVDGKVKHLRETILERRIGS